MRRFLFILGVLAFAAITPAPIHDTRTGEFLPDTSQSRLSKEQSLQTVQGVVGQVPAKTTDDSSQTESSDPQGRDIIGAVSSDPKGASIIADASKKLERKDSGWAGPATLGALCLALGFGFIYALRKFVESKIPEMPVAKKVRW